MNLGQASRVGVARDASGQGWRAHIAREQGEQAAFDWLRGKTDVRVAGLRAEVAAAEAIERLQAGPYGRMNRADENCERTLGVIGDMDMKVTGERMLEGYWIKDSPSSVKCKSPMDGSDYWGRQVMEFDESFRSWSGAWTYCDLETWHTSRGDRIQEP